MVKAYDRISAVNYAHEWALARNPAYYNFDTLGGDCTNFASQCIFAGAKIMNYTPVTGWYYNGLNSRTPAWTGVDFLLKFLTGNRDVGPFASEVSVGNIDVGDVIFLGKNSGDFYHTVIVSEILRNDVLICCHTRDARDRSLYEYNFERVKFIHIAGVRI